MFSARLTISIWAAALFAASAAHAADYPQPVYVPAPVIEEYSNWYLRGDIGFSNQQVKNLSNPAASLPLVSSSYGFDAAPTIGLGIGYYFNDWLRFDLTGEYRGRANFHGWEIYDAGIGNATDEYTGSKSEWLFMLNGYVDLGTWNKLTPFVGAGIGFSRNTIHNFQDVCHGCGGNPANNGVSFADDVSKWNFAWALHAGLAYKVSKNFAVELSYRYLDLGKAETGSLVSYDFSQTLPGSTFERLTSHDVRLGLRFNLDAFESYSQPVQYYSPQPQVYTPPPVYAPQPSYGPPLRSRG